MRRVTAAAAALVCFAWVAGCDFSVGSTADGGVVGDDAPDLPSVGFAQASSLHDELSGAVTLNVTLSAPAAGTVTVAYAFTDVTTTRGIDYTATDGTLTFSPGETTQTIGVTIAMDGVEELQDEAFTVTLASPVGATLGASTHTATISANQLPRVTVMTSDASGVETTTPKVTFTLDQMSPVDVAVDFTLAGTATSADYALTPMTVTFPAGMTSQQLDLGVMDDALDEDDETVQFTLANPVGLVIPAAAPVTYTIDDDDATPTVSFTQVSTTLDEDTTTVMVDVTLSAVSGRTVTVPVTLNPATTAANGTDFNVLTSLPLTIPEGTKTLQLAVQINEDMTNEPDENVIFDLGSATNAVVTSPSTHTITINDDDPYCLGVGAFAVCSRQPPTLPVSLPAVLDTTTSPLCAAPGAVSWSGPASVQPGACFVYATTITMTTDVLVIGSRPLVLAASSGITIDHVLDVASHRGVSTGPGAPALGCKAFVQTPGGSSGGGGGAGASFMTKGGDGGGGNGAMLIGVAPAAESTAPTALRAGCHGQRGANSDGGLSGAEGQGGGAVYAVSNGTITITGTIDASGAGATAGGIFAGGSGAGSGGMIVLYAPAIAATGGSLVANGGGGAGGGDNNSVGSSGQDPNPAAPATPAAGGPGPPGGGAGGNGYAGLPPGTAATSGQSVGSNKGGGGGGGGGGYIRANLALTGASVSAGRVDAP